MKVKNGIIIDGVMHEYIESKNGCDLCSLRKECDKLTNQNLSIPCEMFFDNGKRVIFVNRGKVKVEKEETK